MQQLSLFGKFGALHSVQQIGALGKSGALLVSVEWCTGASGRLAIKGGFEVLKMKDKRRRPDKPGGGENAIESCNCDPAF